MCQWQHKNNLSPVLHKKIKKIKIGIVSSHIYNHSVWNAITKGLLLNFDLNKFEVHVFYLGKVFDGETELAKSRSTFFESEKSSLYAWAKLISEAGLDVLIYPEIGMHKLTTQLASLRLCNIQMTAWGHPETTGLPNMDYYLSGDLIEPENADAYTEQLIKLPNLGSCYYKIPVVSFKPNQKIACPDVSEPILLCPGTPFKYDPKNDWIFVEIVKRLGACKLLFFDHREDLTELLKFRLTERFKAQNLAIDDFIVFSPWLESKQFYELMQKSTVFLDTIGFSGFNTAIQAIECTLPIVTKRGEFMRGCLAGGLLKRIGLSELIAISDEGYVDLVVRLVQDQKYHNEVEAKIIKSRHLLYEDTSVVRSLEDFLISKLRNN
jgi:predicted O-linked N-acetylglucosamine transferase (SPINDLY family)